MRQREGQVGRAAPKGVEERKAKREGTGRDGGYGASYAEDW